ncbi:MAG: hypothetical protein GYB64_11685 [Chloroflexi bacterium]|nr:hypothetical protein [Chloroflexota bacterium]
MDFDTLVHRVITAWADNDTQTLYAIFSEEATLLISPDGRPREGKKAIREVFKHRGGYIRVHDIWYDANSQVGTVNLSTGKLGDVFADYSAIIMQLEGEQILLWREHRSRERASRQLYQDDPTWTWDLVAGRR